MNDRKRSEKTGYNGKSSKRPWIAVAVCCIALPYVVSAANWFFIVLAKVPFRIEMTTSEFITYLGTIGVIMWSVYQFSSERDERLARYEREDSLRMHEVLNDTKNRIMANQNVSHETIRKQVEAESEDGMQMGQELEQIVRAADVDKDER